MTEPANPWLPSSTPSTGAGTEGGNSWLPSATGGKPVQTTPSQLPGRRVTSSRVHVLAEEDKLGTFGTAAHSFVDNIMFNTLDETGAWIDTNMPTWLGGTGKSYEYNLRRNRAILHNAEEEHSVAYIGASIAGGFVPLLGWGGRAKKGYDAIKAGQRLNAGRMAAEGAAYGALAGFGASESEDIFDWRRVRDAANGALWGGGGGFMLGATVIPAGRWGVEKASALIREGRTPRLNFKFKEPAADAVGDVAEDLTAARLKYAKKSPAPAAHPKTTAGTPAVTKVQPKEAFNPLTGKTVTELEEGAVVTTKELMEGGDNARKSVLDRIIKLTPQQAKVLSQKLEKSMLTGALDDPHFKSLLGLSWDDVTDDVAASVQASTMLHEIGEALLEKAGMGKKSLLAQKQKITRQFGKELSESDLDKMVARQQENSGSANIGRTVMALAGARFQRATKELLPEVLKGSTEAREALLDALTSSIRISSKGQYLVSSAGRELGSLKWSSKMAFTEVVGDTLQIESAQAIKARVTEALAKLDDTELSELLTRVHDLSDLNRVQEVLLNAASAEALAGWKKARNSVGLWIKSNSLTPMSGIINTVGFVMHDIFRNDWARAYAAHAARMAGDLDTATILQMEREVVKAVTWHAHGSGLKSALSRLKWEWFTSVERITGVAGNKQAALKASASRQAMVAKGYQPPAIREFDQEAGLAITNWRGFNEKLENRAVESGGFGTFVNALERTYAVSINTFDALGTSTARVVSGVLDDWGRNYVKVREVYAQSAAHATREALSAGLPQKELIEYVQNRTAELVEFPTTTILERVERKLVDGEELGDLDRMLLRRSFEAEREAEAVLFMDGPQTGAGKKLASAASGLDKVAGGFAIPGILMTYIRTPTRIFERGLSSYTPWAHLAEESRKALARGGVEAAMEKARMDLGGMIMGIGMMAASAGAFTVTNGGWKNSQNLEGAPANRLNLPGGGYVELSRLDPFALTLALGGIVGQAVKARQDTGEQYDDEEAMSAVLSTAFLGMREAILEKSYLTSARDLFKAVFAEEEGSFAKGWTEMFQSALVRMVPLGGVSRQFNETFAQRGTEAATFMDKLFKVTPGLGAYLPSRYDALGNEVESRDLGLAAGTTSDTDPVAKRVAALGINLTTLAKADPTGFRLNSEELSELRRLRGKEAVNKYGQTMSDALTELLDSPEFQGMQTRDQKQEAVGEVISSFNEPARELFEQRNQGYLAERTAHKAFKDYMDMNLNRLDAFDAAKEDTRAAGLPEPTRFDF